MVTASAQCWRTVRPTETGSADRKPPATLPATRQMAATQILFLSVHLKRGQFDQVSGDFRLSPGRLTQSTIGAGYLTPIAPAVSRTSLHGGPMTTMNQALDRLLTWGGEPTVSVYLPSLPLTRATFAMSFPH